MQYTIQNLSGGLLVCSLKDPDKTLRLNNKEIKTLDEKDMNDYLFNLEKKGYIKLVKESSAKTVVKKTEEINKEKEG